LTGFHNYFTGRLSSKFVVKSSLNTASSDALRPVVCVTFTTNMLQGCQFFDHLVQCAKIETEASV